MNILDQLDNRFFNIRTFLKVLAILAGIVTFAFCFVWVVSDGRRLAISDCKARWPSHATQYVERIGCQVKIADKWYPENAIKISGE